MSSLHSTQPEQPCEVWAFDEHRIGLAPITRRIWAPKGSRPVRCVEMRYDWCYLYGFVHPTSGRTHFLRLPHVNAASFTQALADFAQHVAAGDHKPILLVVDGASWHHSKEVVLPAGIHLLFLPPYSPELQPAERLWPLTNEALANRHFKNRAELEAVQTTRCMTLSKLTDAIRSLTCFHWWPAAS